MKERVDFLLDRSLKDNVFSWRIEQPLEGCMCLGYGLLSKEWLYKRPSTCDCHIGHDDYDNFLHALDCDSVSCPFCPAGQMEVASSDE